MDGTFTVGLADHADIRRVKSEITQLHETIDYLFKKVGALSEALQFSNYGNELNPEVNTLAALKPNDQFVEFYQNLSQNLREFLPCVDPSMKCLSS